MELSEEEKKAIERIEDTFYQDLGKGINKFQKITLYEDDITDIRKLLNLIENQQKEIEELKKWHDVFLEMYIHKDKVGANYISKDKIREKIKKAKEIKWHTPKLVIEYFEELLEEN